MKVRCKALEQAGHAMPGVCGRHRQLHTGRLLSYWSTFDADGDFVTYVGTVRDGPNFVGMFDGELTFEPDLMSADEAVRQDLGRFIDTTDFGPGTPPQPSWTDYGPYK